MNRKPIFDAVRELLGRPFTQSEVSKLDQAIDSAEAAHPPASPHPVGEAGLALIKRFEGCAKRRADGRYEAYPDPATGGAPWTIGWGSTGPDIGEGLVWTQAQCDERLEKDLMNYAREVSAVIGRAPTTRNQFEALVSFVCLTCNRRIRALRGSRARGRP